MNSTDTQKKRFIFFDIDYTLFDTHEYKESQLTNLTLYEEIEQMLEEIPGEYTLGILSEGQEEFQKNKLLATKIDHHFDQQHIHIVVNKVENLPRLLDEYKNESIILVDDKLPILYNAKKILPSLFCIWIKRGPYAESQRPIPGFVPDAEIDSLKNLASLLMRSP